MSTPRRRIFITGRSRSGTTLVQSLLTSQPGIRVFNDVLAPLGTMLSRAHGARRALEGRQKNIALASVKHDLRHHVASEALQALDVSTNLDELLERALALLDLHVEGPPKEAAWIGHKSNSQAAALPHLLEETDVHCIYVVRDVRDVMLSLLNFWHTVDPQRVVDGWLNELRVVEPLRGHDRCCVVRYEDLVRSPDAALEPVAAMLDVRLDTTLPLVDERGRPWRANSAFRDVRSAFDASALERWRQSDAAEVAYAAARCSRTLGAWG